jgi:photosystem II stability/assembly factor-like uncharacterized protein
MLRFAWVVLIAASAVAQTDLLSTLQWRSLGPGIMGGRISDIEGIPGDPRTLYVAAGSGGLFKTTNAGTTWTALFDRQPTISIGDIALDPKNSNVIWVGTGESNVRNSVSFGSGVYVSRDGGKTWQHRGLADTLTISRILVDPRNSNRVWVAAMGHPFGPNAERGVFVTEDGGATWKKTLYIDDKHGACDLEADPANPDVLYAGMWAFERKPWRYDSGSTAGGVFQSTDGGKTWRKLTNGLPALMGRIGVKVAPSDPRTVYVLSETREGILFRSSGAGARFEVVSKDRELVGRGYYYCDLRVDPKQKDRLIVLSDALLVSNDGGRKFDRISTRTHGDYHALWIDPADPNRMWQGQDGGLAVSWDAGATWEHVENLSLGQFYQVYADNRGAFYQVTGGTQDNGSWTGPSRTREPGGIYNSDWKMVSPIVGFHALTDAADPDVLLTQMPGGTLLRTDTRTREQRMVGPDARNYSGFTAAEMKYRFGWNAPLARSPHGKDTLYFGSNRIFQSSNYGGNWEPISRDLTKSDASRMTTSGGPVFADNSSSETYGTISRIAESPLKRGLIWAGTDDGNLQVTANGGTDWVNVSAKLPGAPAEFRVAAIEPSRHDAGVVYVALERHLWDDLQPYIYRSTDGGATWKRIDAGLPRQAFVWVVREDPKRRGLLYAGTELGLYASFDDGANWVSLSLANLPHVAVRDVIVQPQMNDIVIATHGRGLYVLDDAAVLQEWGPVNAPHLFPVRQAMRHSMRATRVGGGDKEYAAPNPAYGALLTYVLPAAVENVRFEIRDAGGKVVRTLAGQWLPRTAGVHRVAWDLRADAAAPGPRSRGAQVLPGRYMVKFIAGAVTSEQPLEVILDPALRVERANLEQQWQVSTKLVSMMRDATKVVEAAPALRDRVQRAPGTGRSEMPARLAERLQSLFDLVDSPNDAPTGPMLQALAELEAEYQSVCQEAARVKPGFACQALTR